MTQLIEDRGQIGLLRFIRHYRPVVEELQKPLASRDVFSVEYLAGVGFHLVGFAEYSLRFALSVTPEAISRGFGERPLVELAAACLLEELPLIVCQFELLAGYLTSHDAALSRVGASYRQAGVWVFRLSTTAPAARPRG